MIYSNFRFEYNHREANQLSACTFSAACWDRGGGACGCPAGIVHWALIPNPTLTPPLWERGGEACGCRAGIGYYALIPNPTPDPSPLRRLLKK